MSYDPDALPAPTPPRWRIFKRLRWLEGALLGVERCFQLMGTPKPKQPEPFTIFGDSVTLTPSMEVTEAWDGASGSARDGCG
ncbi:MAG TPA: hypothetical protein VJT16_07100 [Streptosporangiaceae bacterium]|nr:hypothetical protein [Streptosporangiaceae bacterium]